MYVGIFKEGWAPLSLKQCFLMQCSTVHYITLITAFIHYSLKESYKISVALSFIFENVSGQVWLDIFQKRSCDLQTWSLVFDFVVTVNSLLKCLWLHHSCARFFLIFFFPLYLFHPLAFSPFVSFWKRQVFAYCSFTGCLFVPACYITSTEKFDWEETKNPPHSVFLGQVQIEIQ